MEISMNESDVLLRKIAEIEKALEAELYNCALALALTLPDICGKVEFSNIGNKKRYKDWFSSYALPYFTVEVTKLPSKEIVEYTLLSAEECWALRCAFLHAGNYDVECVSLTNVHIHAHKREGENYIHMTRDAQSADWDVIELCKKLCLAAREYYLSIEDKTRFDLNEVRIDTW